MSRSSLNFLIDTVVAGLFLSVMSIASVIHFIFPGPSRADGVTVFGWTLDSWSAIQGWSLALFGVGIIVHVIFHWTWVCGFVTARLSKWTGRRIALDPSARTLYGVVFLISVLTVLGLIYGAASFSVVGLGG